MRPIKNKKSVQVYEVMGKEGCSVFLFDKQETEFLLNILETCQDRNILEI